MRARLPLLAFAAILATAAHAESMYKWVDEKGVTHFSSDPPPDGKGQKLDVRPTPPSSPARAAGAQDWNARAIELREERLQREQGAQSAQRKEADNTSRCLRARKDAETLRRQIPVYSANEQGERVYMDDAKRAAAMEAAQKAIEAYCPR